MDRLMERKVRMTEQKLTETEARNLRNLVDTIEKAPNMELIDVEPDGTGSFTIEFTQD